MKIDKRDNKITYLSLTASELMDVIEKALGCEFFDGKTLVIKHHNWKEPEDKALSVKVEL